MNYIITIPSYGRASICNNKTLKALNSLGIDKKLINVFVVKEEYTNYKKELNEEWYNEIIIGEKGLVQQREFINNYYPENSFIISIDDDIESLDLSLTSYISADQFFKEAFELCVKECAYIWGLYPVFNPFFRKSKVDVTTNLNYIIGAFYGYINRNDNDLKLSLTTECGNKEDVERTILYWLKDGKVIRFNKIGFKTKYYGTQGGLGTLKDRLERMKIYTIKINETYPDLTKIKIRKNGLYEIVFKSTSKIPAVITDDSPIYPLGDKLLNPDDYIDVYNLLENSIITKQTNKIGRARTFGDHRAIVLGYITSRISRKYQLSYETKKRPELYQAILKLGKSICPFDFHAIQVNHNLTCCRHKDKGNIGKSLIVSFGDYIGCNLVIEPFGEYNTNCRPLIFDGCKYFHYNTPKINGNKYSLVFYTNPNHPSSVIY